ncbi:MAG: hypothetical protein GEV07_30820 [Streptosporangiales bacterium]|nr:hypothetical protein [Streptosporangiales bacterium]
MIPLIGLVVLGAWLVFLAVCVGIAARKGVWLRVDMRVRQTVEHRHEYTHRHFHRHRIESAADEPATHPSSRVVEGWVLARAVLPSTPSSRVSPPPVPVRRSNDDDT